MREPASEYRPTPGEEIANSVTHGVGTLLAIAGLVVLAAFSARRGTAWHVVASSIFGACLILSYGSSTLYHGLRQPRAKHVLRVLDHSAIFLLIAGTYTPFTLISLRGPWGWSLFGVVWGLAVMGIVFKVTMLRRWTVLSVGLYLAMGWCVVVAARPMVENVAPGGLALLLAGGVAYTAGLAFYARRRRYSHTVWHLFVLAGSTLHFFAVLLYVIPPAGGR
jgi:hemolysin III